MGDDRSMAELVRRWDELLLADSAAHPESPPTEAVARTGSVLRPPAQAVDVEAAERRLGRELPASYRDFLLLSDGAYADLYGVTTASWARNPAGHSVVGTALLPVADLRWLREADPFFAEVCEDTAEDAGPEHGDGRAASDGAEVWPWTAFAGGLVIATDKGPGTTCLVPFDGEAEWQVWTIHKEMSEAFLSFRSMLEHMVACREPVADLREAERVAVLALEGDAIARERLARVSLPEAVPLLSGLADQGRVQRWAVEGLGRVATDEAVAALRRLDSGWVAAALLQIGSAAARDALADLGRASELDRLGDPRAAALAARALVETSGPPWELLGPIAVLSRTGDASYVPLIRPLLAAQSDQVSLEAARALVTLGEADGLRLLEARSTGDDWAASRARWILAQLDR